MAKKMILRMSTYKEVLGLQPRKILDGNAKRGSLSMHCRTGAGTAFFSYSQSNDALECLELLPGNKREYDGGVPGNELFAFASVANTVVTVEFGNWVEIDA